MRFESREIQDFADPVPSSMLREGSAYFMVTFVDEKMLVPQMVTVAFVGKDKEVGEQDVYYFQDIDSYSDGIIYNSSAADEHAQFFKCSGKDYSGVYDFETALEILMVCSLRRRGLAT